MTIRELLHGVLGHDKLYGLFGFLEHGLELLQHGIPALKGTGNVLGPHRLYAVFVKALEFLYGVALRESVYLVRKLNSLFGYLFLRPLKSLPGINSDVFHGL